MCIDKASLEYMICFISLCTFFKNPGLKNIQLISKAILALDKKDRGDSMTLPIELCVSKVPSTNKLFDL